MKTSVSILCPIAESVSPLCFQSIVALASYASASGVMINNIGVTERTLVDTARNELSKEFLKTDNEWALWLDSDQVYPKDTLVKLLETAEKKKTKLVTGIYYQRGGNHFPVLWKREVELESGKKVSHKDELTYDRNEYIGTYALPGPEAKEPFKVDTAGFGCVLMHRNVLELMDMPYFMFLNGKCSEDFYFFVTARQKGFQLWADPSLDIKHIGQPNLIGKQDCYNKLEENNTQIEPIK